jgi:hypothetical protein
MDWQAILETALKGIITIIVGAAPVWVPMLIAWLRRQNILRTKDQEELAALVIGEAIEAVEAWAKKQGEKPTSDTKLTKAKEIVAKRAPMLKDMEDVVHRIEAELHRRNGG